MLEEAGWPHPVAYAPLETVGVLDTVQGFLMERESRISLPASFLVDQEGRLVAMYFGPVEPDTVLADAAELLTALPEARITAASPFPGTW